MQAEHEPKPGPLIYMTLSFSSANAPAPAPTFTPGANSTSETTATSETEAAECEGESEWLDGWSSRIQTVVSENREVFGAGAEDLGALDPAVLCAAAADLRTFADELALSNPPDFVAAANNGLIVIFINLSDALDSLAGAIETGVQSTIDAAVADFSAVIAAPSEEVSAVSREIVIACPEIG